MPQEVIEITEREIEVIEVVERGPAGPAGPQANINYTVVSSSQTVSSRQLIAADTSGGSFTLTLPANPAAGDAVDIFDYAETFDTNPLTIARNGQKIESLTEDLVCNVEGAYFTLIYTGATRGWQVLPRFGTSGGSGESTLTTQGDMLYRGPTDNTRLPIGTAGQVLRVNSGATAPEWGAAPDSIDDYTVVTTGQTLTNGARIAADTSGGAFTLNLPATPPNGATVYILDYAQTFDTNPLTLARNGSQIEGESQDMECGVKGSSFKMVFTGSANGGWQMIPFFGVAGVASVSGTAPIVSSGGATPTISITPATTSAAGSMSAADKVKLNGAAPLESPALTGTPTAPTAAAGTNTTQIATTAFTLANRGDRYLTTSTSSHSITTGSKTFTVQSGLSYTATQDVTIVYDADPTNKHMHGVVTSYSGTTLVVNVESVEGSGGPFTAWTINVGGLLTAQGALLEANNLSDVANPATALTNIGGVPTSRSISAGTGLTGGGNLTADRTLAVSYGTTAGTAAEGNDARLSDARTPTPHASSHASAGSDPVTLDASQIGSGVFDNARVNFAAPPAIGSTTPAAGTFTNLVANTELQVPSAAAPSPSAGDIYRVTDTIRYRDSGNAERLILNATDNLANLSNTATARTNLGLGSGSSVTFGDIQNTPIGSTTRNSGAFTTLSANNGTLTASAPVLDLAQTWNNAAVTFTGFRFNVTNTNSSALSLFADFQVGGTTQFSVRRDGLIFARNRIEIQNTTVGFQTSAAANGASPVRYASDTNGLGQIYTSGNVVELLGTTTTSPQTFRLYNTFTDASNFERGFMRWSSNNFEIGSEAGGTGSNREVRIVAGTATYRFATNSNAIFPGTLNISSAAEYQWFNRSRVRSSASGLIELLDSAGTSFDRLQFGGTTSSFPALKRSSTTLQVRLADDSAFADFECGGSTFNSLMIIRNSSLLMLNGGSIRLQTSAGADTAEIARDAAGIVALRSGTTAHSFRVYNTSTSSNANFERANFRWAANEFIIDAEAGGTGTSLRGIKIGSATSSLLGFYGATPVDRPATVADPTGGGTVDAEARTAINDLIDRLQELGLIA